jgi:hypothetical protein
MNLARRIKHLEEKARAVAFGDLTLAVVRRMMDGTLTEAEWRHYGPILKSLLYPNEVARQNPFQFDACGGAVVCSPPREESPPQVSGWKPASEVRNF